MPTTAGSRRFHHLLLCIVHIFPFLCHISLIRLDSRRYNDNKHEKFGSLRVINEDRVEPRTGFGTHSHREFEIFSYIVSGELQQYVLDISPLKTVSKICVL